jgi:hypothetical protein
MHLAGPALAKIFIAGYKPLRMMILPATGG